MSTTATNRADTVPDRARAAAEAATDALKLGTPRATLVFVRAVRDLTTGAELTEFLNRALRGIEQNGCSKKLLLGLCAEDVEPEKCTELAIRWIWFLRRGVHPDNDLRRLAAGHVARHAEAAHRATRKLVPLGKIASTWLLGALMDPVPEVQRYAVQTLGIAKIRHRIRMHALCDLAIVLLREAETPLRDRTLGEIAYALSRIAQQGFKCAKMTATLGMMSLVPNPSQRPGSGNVEAAVWSALHASGLPG